VAAGLALGYASASPGAPAQTVTTILSTPPTSPPATTTAATTVTIASTTAAPPTTAASATTVMAPTYTAAHATPSAASHNWPPTRDLDRGCLAFAAVAIWLPGHRLPQVVGPVAHAPWAKRSRRIRIVFPADGSIIDSAGTISASQCGRPGEARGFVILRQVSLLDSAVTADEVTLRITGGAGEQTSLVADLHVEGGAVAVPRSGRRLRLGEWGYLIGLSQRFVDTQAPGARRVRRLRTIGLDIHLLRRRSGLPAGADVQLAVANLESPAPAAMQPAGTTTPEPRTEVRRPMRVAVHHPGRAGATVGHSLAHPTNARATTQTHAPLTETPQLGPQRFIFPVVGDAFSGDTYGAFRSDAPGGWHHGDDIFAPFGSPVVAVAAGTLNRVGWEHLGGWRLWVRDKFGDEFYYAHLAGYAPLALQSKHVQAGEVIGFVGNSGDAFPSTPPHLHFEVHPRTLLRLHYDGAVDPTTYLGRWARLKSVLVPYPQLPSSRTLPSAQVKQETTLLFRRLLTSRGLLRKPHGLQPASNSRPALLTIRSAKSGVVAAEAAVRSRLGFDFAALFIVLGGAAIMVGFIRLYSRRAGALRPREGMKTE
jgi:murein DD-endopeptidase MepM/ murein hydrolase activator NlpD